ncbi:MAG: FecR domain-containing protein [Phenylobacterium sp.]|uniref:FecR family protein n=1 Tax=Phenylobacterium sp. TaxID=1871053 RepID=UPI00272680AE|nr:FecR domain-containing protein [Phenylobacterium sp.]MDO8901822.1 FecR domain-containing protein [Phenylobacterium sp.]MDP2212307.1 FecR domain-containing protein [Phenylobacterium sp.]
MSKVQAAREIDDEAALWAVRADARGLDPAADPELSAWLAADPRRVGAYLRAEAALSLLDRARALPANELAPQAKSGALPRRALLAWGGATAAAAIGGTVFFLGSGQEQHVTGLGEIRRVPMADGTQIVMNTESSLKVRVTSNSRQVALLRGEAWFDVAKDPARPFLVKAGAARFQALGTAFSVRHQATSTDLQVTDGAVQAWVADGDDRAEVSAGHRLSISEDAGPLAVRPDPAAIRRSLAWRQGEVVLDGETLAEAAAEFNRYNALKIVVEDPELGQEQLVGLFRTGDPEAFVRSVTTLLGAEARRDGGTLRLRRP